MTIQLKTQSGHVPLHIPDTIEIIIASEIISIGSQRGGLKSSVNDLVGRRINSNGDVVEDFSVRL